MKKQIATAVIATLLTTTAAPALANDAVRLGVGILGLVINEAAKGRGGNARQPRKGDQLIGRVGEEPRRNSGSRNRNKVAPVAGGAAVAAVALALPEGAAAPIPLPKPTAEEMTAYLASVDTLPPISSPVDGAEIELADEIPMTDEQGRFWGNVSPEDAEKIARAERELGMKLSVAIPAITGLKEPQASVQVADSKPAEFPIVAGADMAAQGQPEAARYGTIWNLDRTKGTLLDETQMIWCDESADVIAQIDKATDDGMKRSDAIRQFSQYGEPCRTKEYLARVEQERLEVERQWAERRARAEAEEAARVATAEEERKAAIAARERVRAEYEAAQRKAEEERQAEIAEAKRRAEEEALLGAAPAVDPSAMTASVTEAAAAVVETKTDLENAAGDKADAIQQPAKKPKLDL